MSFVEDFDKMPEGEQETDSREQVNARECGVHSGGFEKSKSNQQNATYKAVLTTGETNGRRISQYRRHNNNSGRHRRKGVRCNATVGRLCCYIREEWRQAFLARTEEEIDKVAKDTNKEISRVKDFLASRTKKAPSIGSASSEIDFEDEKAPKPSKTHELPVSRADRNLERTRLPKFNGDKTKFEYFWATFESIVDETDEPTKYKMIRLKSCLEGKAEEAISKLGFSERAYNEANNTLKRRFGGERRQLQNYLEDVKNIKPLREGSIQELEKFADIFVSIIVALREHNHSSELEPGSLLFSLVVEKIPKTMLSRYFCWPSENHRLELLETLRDWIPEESEYQVKATESIDGLGAKAKHKEDDRRKNRTFTTSRGRRKEASEFFVKEVMGYGRVSS